MDNFFKRAGDLIDDKEYDNTIKSNRKYFYEVGDFGVDKKVEDNDISIDEIKKYLRTIVSGVEYDMECELGTLCSGGFCIISFNELKNMIDEGCYNIISAECFNKDMISIEYQQFSKDYSRKF